MAVNIEREWTDGPRGFFTLHDDELDVSHTYGPYAYAGDELHTIAEKHAEKFHERAIRSEALQLRDRVRNRDEAVARGNGATEDDVLFLLFQELIDGSSDLDLTAHELLGLCRHWRRSDNETRTRLTGLKGEKLRSFSDAVRDVLVALRTLRKLRIQRGLAADFSPRGGK